MSSYEQYKDTGRSIGAILHHLHEMGIPLHVVEDVRVSNTCWISYRGSPFATVAWDTLAVPTFTFTGYAAAVYTNLQRRARGSGHFSHYKWLELYLPKFLKDCNVLGGWDANVGIIAAHGDKFYQYREQFAKAGLHFAHGCAIGLLTYCSPYSRESRETKNGWVAPVDWIVDNGHRFVSMLPSVDETDDRYMEGRRR